MPIQIGPELLLSLLKSLKPPEVNALSSGVETLLRRLIRVLIGHMSLTRLEEVVRLVFVEEADRHLRAEYKDRSVPMAQLALLTGIDTRQLNKLKAHPEYQNSQGRSNHFMSNMTPTTHLLDKWSTDPELLDPESGQPVAINVMGEAPSIETLMKDSTFIRGVTPRSVADRLELSGAAKMNPNTGQLHMITEKFLPSSSHDVEGAIEVGFNAIGHLLNTVVDNLERLQSDDPRLYQRCYWTNRLAPHQQAIFRDTLTQLMMQFEDEGTQTLTDFEMKIEAPSQVTAGFGLYYFEDSQAS